MSADYQQVMDLERQLLGILMGISKPSFAKETVFKLSQKGLKPEWFSYSYHRKIYEAIAKVVTNNQPINIIEIMAVIKQNQDIEDFSPYHKLLTEITLDKYNVHDLLSIVSALKETYFRSKIHQMSSLFTTIANQPILDTDTAIAECQQAIHLLINETVLADESNDELGAIMEDYLTNLLSEDSTPIYDTGLYDLDHLLQFTPKTLNVLAGRPSMGKTAMALFLLFAISFRHKKPCYLFSLEMAKDQLVERFATMASNYEEWKSYDLLEVNSWRLNQHKLSKLPSRKNDTTNLPLNEDEINNLHIINDLFNYHQKENSLIGICDDREITPVQIEMKCVEFMQKKKVDSLGLVVIDYIQEMAKGSSTNSAQRSNEIGIICRQLRDISKRINTPILLLAQLNQGVESRNDKRPNMSDLADSGAIAQSADTILMMYREGYYNPDSPDKAIAEVLVKKNRVSGPTGVAKFIFHPHQCVFKNIVNEYD